MNDRVETIEIQEKSSCIIQAKILHYPRPVCVPRIGRGNTEKLIIYFFKAWDFITPSYLKLREKIMLNQIKFRRHSGAMVRFSTPILDGSVEEAFTTLKDFMSRLIPILPEYLP